MSQTISKSQLRQYQGKLNQLLSKVTECVNKKVNDPSKLDKFKDMFRRTQPKNLKGGLLKEYQKQALVWMIQLAHKNMNGILADDMGLGKTIQTIAYFAYLKQQHGIRGKFMIVAPLTVLNNWKRELNKWMPELNAVILWATEKQRQQILSTVVRSRNFDVLITSYQGAMYCQNTLRKINWETLVVDEAHKIKNDEAIISQTIRMYRCNFKLLLTGTPLSNNLRELWSLLNFIMPDIFMDRALFDLVEEGVKFYQGTQAQRFQIQCQIAKKFHGIIRPFIMRRTKKDTDLGLPSKTQHTLFVSMTKLQLKMYKNFLKYRSVFGKGGHQQNNSQMLTRKICNHPYLIDGIQSEGNDQFGEHLILNCGKMIVLDKLLKKMILQEKRKVLIFSQFKIQMDILEDYFTFRQFNFLRLDGETGVQERQILMDRFNNDTKFNIPIFMLSTRAGGLGINLVAASVVIIYDIDWNPQNDNQAMDRAYRIGQTRPVNVYKMITEHTIEQRMLEVQKYKLIWDQLVIQKGAVMNLKNQDVLEGLNYQKIANMKKGQIFKIQADTDNRTIDEIIKIGKQKDQGKYNQIKKKIEKQIQEQKTNSTFNANPFQDNQIQDKQGQKYVKQFQGQAILNDPKSKKNIIDRVHGRNMTKYRKKLAIMSSINLPQFHLYEDIDQVKQIMYEIEIRKYQIQETQSEKERLDKNHLLQSQLTTTINRLNVEIKQQQLKLKKINQSAFCQWEQDEYQAFINQQRQQLSSNAENIKNLRKLIPTKTINQIKAYKAAFYSFKNKKLQKVIKVQKQILKTQVQASESQEKSQFYRNLKQKDYVFTFAKKSDALQVLLNNMKISSGIQQSSVFLQSKQFLKNPIINELKKVNGQMVFNESAKNGLVTTKQLMKAFFNTKQFSEAKKMFKNSQFATKNFQQKKKRVLDEVNRKILDVKSKAKDSSKQEEISTELVI